MHTTSELCENRRSSSSYIKVRSVNGRDVRFSVVVVFVPNADSLTFITQS